MQIINSQKHNNNYIKYSTPHVAYLRVACFTSPCIDLYTMCPRSSDPFYIVTYYMKRVTNCCTYSMITCITHFEFYLRLLWSKSEKINKIISKKVNKNSLDIT